jgi:diguanylate cyclase (GGDEF)-like protein
VDGQRAWDTDHSSADADQSAADSDQTASDADQTASGKDQTSADRDQRASDRDQATADRDRATDHTQTEAEVNAYNASRDERETVTSERLGTRLTRADTSRDRDETATQRDRVADARDEAGHARDDHAAASARSAVDPDSPLLLQLELVQAAAAADRARAAADRERAAQDRRNAARERERLEAELHSAHLDGLTGAYRREMGQLALSHEIDRARRSDGRFVLAFVDVDRLKAVNDREGHAAGDRVLQAVVHAIRTRLRSFDPIIRYGGDEFVCGLGGTDLAEARRRFDEIGVAIEKDTEVGISVGLAPLGAEDTADQLIERADAAMLEIKATHHSEE